MFKYRFSFQERICQISGYKLCLLNSKNSRCNTSLSFGLQWITSFPTILFYFEKSLLESEWIPVQKRKICRRRGRCNVSHWIVYGQNDCNWLLFVHIPWMSTVDKSSWINSQQSFRKLLPRVIFPRRPYIRKLCFWCCHYFARVLTFVIFCYSEKSDTTTCNANWHWIWKVQCTIVIKK